MRVNSCGNLTLDFLEFESLSLIVSMRFKVKRFLIKFNLHLFHFQTRHTRSIIQLSRSNTHPNSKIKPLFISSWNSPFSHFLQPQSLMMKTSRIKNPCSSFYFNFHFLFLYIKIQETVCFTLSWEEIQVERVEVQMSVWDFYIWKWGCFVYFSL